MMEDTLKNQTIHAADMIEKTALPRLSTGDLDLENLPERLDDTMMAAVQKVAYSELPALPTCDSKTFGQVLRMMLAALPRRQADDISGELFVAAYERQLGHISRPQAEYLLDKALRTCRWFPTIAECHELLGGWRRSDEHTRRQVKAQNMMAAEERARANDRYDWSEKSSMIMSQKQVDDMPEALHRIGLKCGALYIDETTGKVRPVRESTFSDDF